MKYLTNILLILFSYSCNVKTNSKEERKLDLMKFDTSSSLTKVKNSNLNSFKINYIECAFDSSVFEIDSIDNLNITKQNSLKLSSMFKINSKSPKYFTFFDSIVSCKIFYISKKDNLTTDAEKRAEIYKGLLELYMWSFRSSYNIKKLINRYPQNFNSTLQPYSKSIIKDSTILYLIDKSGKMSIQYKEASAILDRINN